MRTPIYQVDAFAGAVFGGNPAAVCPLEAWLDDDTMQAVARENNLSETAFFVRNGSDYDLRWFTPGFEVDLCGHATLASAYVIFEFLERERELITFNTKSGPLLVKRDGEFLAMDFPAWTPERCDPPARLTEGLGKAPVECWKTRDLMAVYEHEEDVRAIEPGMEALSSIDAIGIMATAPGREVDFVSRFFAPRAGIPEDPVTGSAHCTLTPYWAKRLGKNVLSARQVSARGGELQCELKDDRVAIKGRAVLYLEGTAHIPAGTTATT